MKDGDFKQFHEMMFANLHDSFKLSKINKEGAVEHVDVTTDMPEDLKSFYLANNISFKNFSRLQQEGNMPVEVWQQALTTDNIKKELERQGCEKPSLAFAFRWFYNDLKLQGKDSSFYSAYPSQKKQQKLNTNDQMQCLAYLSYLRLLGYLQCGEEASSNRFPLFTELFKVAVVETANHPDPQLEEVFTFLEMLRISFPNGEKLTTPESLVGYEDIAITGEERPPNNYVRLLGRIFALVETPSVSDAALATNLDFDSAQFCCLIKLFKTTWLNLLSVLLCRAFMSGKTSMKNQPEVTDLLSFSKKPYGLGSLLVKALLTDKGLD